MSVQARPKCTAAVKTTDPLPTYNGRTVIPLDVTGCGSAELRAKVAAIHDAEAAQRQADADALSAQTDPFTSEVDLNCE